MQDFTGRDQVIFEQAVLLPESERPAYLDQACANNADLRSRVEGLLRARDAAQSAGTSPDDDDWPSSIPRPAAVGQKVGPYKLIEELGAGGGGMVFLAEQETPVRRRVALKIIKLGMDTEEVIARFEAERQALAMMEHPNIARVFDAGATPTGRPYFVMELVRGMPITQYCDENKLGVAERLKLFILVCNAVQHAHQKGIIHRDIKPSNILVADHDGTPTPKIIDFGIAKATGGRLTDKTYYTTHEQFVGTPAYMSPEQAEMSNLDVDTRSDIYSLGVVLYQLLTSQTPLDGHELNTMGVDEARRRIREEEPLRPSARLAAEDKTELATTAQARAADPATLIAQIRGDLDWIVMRCLEKDRQRRYESASALAQDLQRHLDNQPVVARPPSTLYSLQKMVQRHQVVFVTSSVVAFALVAGLWAVTWSYYNERNAHHAAEAEKVRADAQAALAKSATTEAEQQKHEVQAALSRADYLAALSLLQDDRASEAVAHLVRALRATPDNRPAAALLCSILTMRNWPVLVSETPSPRGTGGGRRGGGGPPGRGGNFPTEAANAVLARSADDSRELRRLSVAGPVQVVETTGAKREFPAIRTDSAILSANLSADGQRVVTVSVDRTARLWDAETAQPLSEPLRHSSLVRAAQFSADGRRVIIQTPEGRGRQGVAYVWDFVENPALLLQINEPTAVTSFSASTDGHSLLAVEDGNATVRVLDAATGRPLSDAMKPEADVRSTGFSPDARHVLTVARNNLLQVWEVTTARALALPVSEESRPTVGQRPLGINAVFSPDSRQLAASFGRTVFVFATDTGKEVLPSWRLDGPVNSVAFSPDGRRLLSASANAQVWDAAAGKQILEFAKDTGALTSASFSADGKSALTVSRSGIAQTWDAQSGAAISEVIRPGDQNLSALFSPDGMRVLTFSRAQDFGPRQGGLASRVMSDTARVWDAATGQPISAVMPAGNNLKSASFSADGRWVITSADDARVWDANTGLAVSVPITCREALLAPDGQRLLVLDDDGVVRVWPFSDRVGPTWILDLAETLAHCRLDATGSPVYYAGQPLDELQRLATQENGGGQPMVLWAKHLLGVYQP